MAKSTQRLEAKRLRREKGLGIRAIAQILGVSKNSASLWCREIELTKKQVDKLIENAKDKGEKGRLIGARLNKEERLLRQKNLEAVGKKKIGNLTKKELFLVGSALYWAEGSKKDRRTTFVNSDPVMILLYIKWLRECLEVKVEDIYCHISINQDHQSRIKKVENYWSRITGISLENFSSPSYKKVKNRKFYANFNKHYGSLFVKVKKGTNLNYEILGYIEGLKKNI